MSFWRILLGDLGQNIDISAAESDIESLKKVSQAKSHVDRKQDTTIGRLEQRVFELEQGLAALMKLLHGKGVLGPAELQRFARFMTEAESRAMAAKPKFDSDENRAAEILREIDES